MRRFRITSDSRLECAGMEFEVDDDATEDDIAKEAADLVISHVSFGWEPVEDDEEREVGGGSNTPS